MYKQVRKTIITITLMLFVVLVLIFLNSSVSYGARADSDGNSWRYSNGEPITETSDSSNNKSIPRLLLGTSPLLGYPSTPGVAGAYRKGLDVSEFQGDIDWATVKASGIDYVILRIGFGNVYNPSQGNYEFKLDAKFVRNASECERLGIPYGVYVFAYSNSVAESKWEAQSTINILKNYHLDYPVYYDVEDNGTIGSHSNYDMCQMTQAFCQTMEDAGYSAGIYASLSWFNNKLNSSVLDKFEKWVAQWYDICEYTKPYGMWQCTSDYYVSGISGRVDLDYVKDRSFNCWRHTLNENASKAATLDSDGSTEYWQCNYCNRYYADAEGKKEIDLSDTIIYKVSRVELDNIYFKHDGKKKEPGVSVVDRKGHELTEGTDYDVVYSNNVEIGTAKAIVSFKGKYSGSVEKSFEIETGITLKGTVYCYSGTGLKVVIEDSNGNKKTATTTEYRFGNLEEGTYKLTVSADGNYVGREYTVHVADEVVKDVELCQLGDTDCDGALTAADVTLIARHVALLSKEQDEYKLRLYDINGDKSIRITDATRLARYVASITQIL